jgi:hypothetical protein
VLGATTVLATSAQANPSGSDLPPVSDLIGTESFVELGTVDVDAVEALLDDVEVAQPQADEDYERSAFGPAWPDTDDNGCDTRNDILTRDLIRVAVDEDCVVQSGVLNDIFTGTTIDFTRGVGTSSAVQIDHMIPLGNAWYHGASEWTDEQRREFSNDPTNLTAVDGPTNGSKSDRGPGSWMPPNEDYHCTYAARYTYVAADWDLSITQDDVDAITAAFDSCTNALPETPEPTATATRAAAPSPTATADPSRTPTTPPETIDPTQVPTPPVPTPTNVPTVTDEPEEAVEASLTVTPKEISTVAFGQDPPGGVTVQVDGLDAGQVVDLHVKSPTEQVGELDVEMTADASGTAVFIVRSYVKSFPGVYGVTVTGGDVDLYDTFTVVGDIEDADPAPGDDNGDGKDDSTGDGGSDLPRTGPTSVAAALILAASFIGAGVAVLLGVRRTRR